MQSPDPTQAPVPSSDFIHPNIGPSGYIRRQASLRDWIPLLGLVALLAVAFKLPNMIRLVFGFYICPSCNEPAPWVTTLAGAYFAFLTALACCFPALFTRRWVAYLGLLWALFLAAYLIGGHGSFLIAPKDGRLCPPCVVAHAAHILMWLGWWLLPADPALLITPRHSVALRLCVVFTAGLAGLGAFAALHRMLADLRFAEDRALTTRPAMTQPFVTFPRVPATQQGAPIPFRVQ